MDSVVSSCDWKSQIVDFVITQADFSQPWLHSFEDKKISWQGYTVL